MAATEPLLRPLHERDDELAIRVGERALTYAELRGAAGAVARAVAGHERVAVWAEPTLETCVAVVGALAAGVAVVPIPPRLGEAELRHVLDDSEPELLLGAPSGLAGPTPAVVDLAARAELPRDELDPEHPALIVYTSGHDRPAQGGGAAAPRAGRQPRRARRGLGVDGGRPC